MKYKKQGALPPLRWVALITDCLMICGSVVTILLYRQTLYLPLLLVAILQLFPAVANLFLLLPIGKQKNNALPEEQKPTETAPEPAEDIPAEAAPAEELSAGQRLLHGTKEACRRFGRWLASCFAEQRDPIVGILVVVALIGFNAWFWAIVSKTPLPGLLYYYVPVALAALLVLYIVLDKWCKHAGAKHCKEPEEDAEPSAEQLRAQYDRAILNSLRGALSVARLAFILEAAIIMLRMLNVVDWSRALIVMVSLLFGYETVFLLISLAVRFIRRELSVTPELTIPMPGLGADDLGILSYLEKNTGITMRSLWSIRLVGKIVPYAVMSMVLLLWGFSGVVKVEAHQQGAHYRLGVLQDEVLEPGLHMTLPWPFDTVEIYETELIKQATIGYISEGGGDNIWTEAHGTEEYKLLSGGGKELVSINMRVEFVIDDLHTYLTGSAAPESLMQAAAYELVTANTIGTDLKSLLSIDRIAFAERFKADLIARTAEHKTGLRIVSVVLESIHPPVDIADVYQEVVNATIQAEQDIATARGEAEVKIIQALTNSDSQIKEAEIQQIIAIAAAHAAVAEFEGNKEADATYGEAYRYYKYLNAICEAYSDGNIILVGDGVDVSKIYIGSLGSK